MIAPCASDVPAQRYSLVVCGARTSSLWAQLLDCWRWECAQSQAQLPLLHVRAVVIAPVQDGCVRACKMLA